MRWATPPDSIRFSYPVRFKRWVLISILVKETQIIMGQMGLYVPWYPDCWRLLVPAA